MSLFKKRTAKSAPVAAQSGERRQLTVLFYDIVGSTSLAVAGDPEGLRAALDEIHAAARQAFAGHGGSLQQVMGDGGMAYFGFPVANEDAAFSAVQAALALLAAREAIPQAPMIRIGIATSVVVLSEDPSAAAGGGLGAVGVAPNLAARLEAAAPPGTIMVSPTTRALTHRAVDYEAVQGLSLKGFPDLTEAWRPLGLKDVASRHDRDRGGRSAFSGRTAEQATLTAAWEAACARGGTAILIEGEPGIGKSRIVADLRARATEARTLVLQCQPRTEGEALFSIIEMYDHAYEADKDAGLSEAAVRTAERLGALEDDDSLSPDARRAAIVAAVVEEVERLARTQPLLILAEDLHWADEVTLAVLEKLSLNASALPLLLLATSRPSEKLRDLRDILRSLPLSPLDPEAAMALVRAVATRHLSKASQAWILERGDGNPLFLIELTAHACDAGETVLQGADVFTLRDLLATRLEGAGTAKRTAQIASVLGRAYPHHLLARLAGPKIGPELDADLQRLIDHGIKEALGNGYDMGFRHALVRDVAYDSQLRSVRKALHGQVVALVDADPGLADDVHEILLAEHCLAADMTARGVGHLLNVAEEAIRRSARHAPRATLERVLALTDGLDAGPERDLYRLRAYVLLGPLVTYLNSPRAAAPLYEAGQALYFQLPEAERAPYFPILWGWWFTASDLREQTKRSEVLIRDVRPEADAESRLQALHCGWATLFDGGAHDRCLSAISDGLALYDPEVGRRSMHLYGHDARVCGLGERALCGWLTGDLEASAAAIAECEAWADETAHAGSRLHALEIATQVAFFNRDLPAIERILTKITSITGPDAAPAAQAKRQIFQGWMAARAGDLSQADAVADGLARLRAFGVLEDTPFFADIAASVTAAGSSAAAALGPLEEEIAEARATGLIYWLPELLRRKAVLLGAGGAEAALDDGWAVAQAQNAQMLALRNLGTRLDLGLAIPSDIAATMAERIDGLSDSDLRRKVLNGLAL